MSKITFADGGPDMEVDPYLGFKKAIGYTIIIATVLYGILVTVLLVFFGTMVTADQLLWSFMNTITSSMMGWLMAKSSTVIDNMFGTSQGSERKTELMAKAAETAASTTTETAKVLAKAECEEEK